MRGQRKNPRKAVQPFENKKRKIDIFKNYEANGVEKIQRKLEIFSTLISKKSTLDLNEYLVANPASTFFVYVTGDSMDLAGMDEGDLLVVDRSPEPKNGDIVIMSINNEFTVKRYMKDDKGLRLLPESSNPSTSQSSRKILMNGALSAS